MLIPSSAFVSQWYSERDVRKLELERARGKDERQYGQGHKQQDGDSPKPHAGIAPRLPMAAP